MAYSGRELIGIGKQSAKGTARTTGYSTVITDGSFSASENVTAINDQGRRGRSEAMDFGQSYGRGSSDISFGGTVALDNSTGTKGSVVGILLRNLFGTGAAVTDTAGSALLRKQVQTTRYDNFFRLGSLQGREYLTVAQSLMGSTADKQIKDCVVTNLTITADTESMVSYTATLTGQPATIASADGVGINVGNSTSVMVPYTNDKTFSSLDIAGGTGTSGVAITKGESAHAKSGILLPDGNGSTVNLTGAATLISAEWSFSREATPVYTIGSKTAATRGDYDDIHLGPLEVTCSFVFYAKDSVAQVFRGQGRGFVQTAWQSGTENTVNENVFAIGAKDVSFAEGPLEIDSSATYSTMALSGRAIWTPTAAGNAPLSDTNYATGTPVEVQITETAVNEYDQA